MVLTDDSEGLDFPTSASFGAVRVTRTTLFITNFSVQSTIKSLREEPELASKSVTELRQAIERDLLQSIILWGPPGCGKTGTPMPWSGLGWRGRGNASRWRVDPGGAQRHAGISPRTGLSARA
mgnify:CR=1 FL=1